MSSSSDDFIVGSQRKGKQTKFKIIKYDRQKKKESNNNTNEKIEMYVNKGQ